MILAIDIGNSRLALGCLDGETVIFTEHVSTDLRKTELEYAIILKTVLELHRIPPNDLHGAVIASVVPPLMQVLRRAIAKIAPDAAILIVDNTIDTGLPLLLDHPEQVGSDLIVDAVAAKAEYGTPVLVIDLGTATTISVIDKDGCYIGGAILPGVQVSLNSLVSGTAQLPHISLSGASHVLGTNTMDSMRSGAVFGNASAIDGMIDRIWTELGYETALTAVGDLADAVIPHCRHHITIDPALPLKGLRMLYQRNCPEEKEDHHAACD